MPYTNLNRAQIRGLLRDRLQNVPFFADQELNDRINGGIRLFQLGTNTWKQRFVFTTVARRVFYDLTTQPELLDKNKTPLVLMPLRATFNGQPMNYAGMFDLDNSSMSDWQTETMTVTPTDVPGMWGMVGVNYFFIVPADLTGGGSIEIDAAIRAPVLNGDTDFLNLDSSLVPRLLDYAQFVASWKRGAAIMGSLNPKLNQFWGAVTQANSMLRAQAVFKMFYGDQADRRRRPRTTKEMTGQPAAVGFR